MEYYFYNTDANSLSRDRRFPILIKKGIAATSGPKSFGEQLGRLSESDTLVMYENGLGVVAVGRVLESWDQKTHRPPVYYQPGDDGFDHEYRIKVNWFLDLSENPISSTELKRRIGSTPRGAVRRIIKHRSKVERLIEQRMSAQSFFPEEVSGPTLYVEGATRRVSVNSYERNPAARRDCIAAHGIDCCICGFNFGDVYGRMAEGYIHVHHLRPLSEIDGEYEVDPVEDLRPVCPNCHAVLHLGGRCRTIEQLRKIIR